MKAKAKRGAPPCKTPILRVDEHRMGLLNQAAIEFLGGKGKEALWICLAKDAEGRIYIDTAAYIPKGTVHVSRVGRYPGGGQPRTSVGCHLPAGKRYELVWDVDEGVARLKELPAEPR